MSNIRLSEDLIHQLEELPLNQLLEVKAKVDSLIVDKSGVFQSTETPVKKTESDVSYLSATIYESRSGLSDVDFQRICSYFSETSKLLKEKVGLGFIDQENKEVEDDSVEKALYLVNMWLKEDSNYDEENYSQIEAGLQQNRNLPQK